MINSVRKIKLTVVSDLASVNVKKQNKKKQEISRNKRVTHIFTFKNQQIIYHRLLLVGYYYAYVS